MKKAAVVLLIGLLMVALLVVPALTKGGSAKGTLVNYYVGTTLYESIIYRTGSGIIHQWVFTPDDMHVIFKPLSKFPNHPGPDYWPDPWPYNPSTYTELGGDEGNLSDFFEVSEQYWVMQVDQD